MSAMRWIGPMGCLLAGVLLSQWGPALPVSAAPGSGVPFAELQRQIDTLRADIQGSQDSVDDLRAELDVAGTLLEVLQGELNDARQTIDEQEATLAALRSRMLYDVNSHWIGWIDMTFEGPTEFRSSGSGATVGIHHGTGAVVDIRGASSGAALAVAGEAQFWLDSDPVEPTVLLNALETRDPLTGGILSERAVVQIHGGLVSANRGRDAALGVNFYPERPLSVLVTGPGEGEVTESCFLATPLGSRPDSIFQASILRASQVVTD